MTAKKVKRKYDFIALDVETANSDYSSICQIGCAFFKDNKVINVFCTYIDPEAHFSHMNIKVHGIKPEMVKESPKFPYVFAQLRPLIENEILIHHTAFDWSSINQAAKKYDERMPDVRWVDTAVAARKTWDDCRGSGYGLHPLADKFGITYKSHDALEDARACGELFLHIVQASGIPIEKWAKRREWVKKERKVYPPIELVVNLSDLD